MVCCSGVTAELQQAPGHPPWLRRADVFSKAANARSSSPTPVDAEDMDDSLWMQLSGHNSLGTPNIDGFFDVIIYFDCGQCWSSLAESYLGCQAASVRKQFGGHFPYP